VLACVGVIGREDGEGAGGGDKLDAPEPIAASPCGPFLRTDGRGGLRADPLAQRRVADAGVDARLAGTRTAFAERRRADDAQRAGRRVTEPDTSARIALRERFMGATNAPPP
jgi:hypothetical protein